MLYQITDKNVQDGYLTDEDFSIGFNDLITTFSFDDFPHINELLHKRTLPSNKLKERADAIYKALQERDLVQIDGKDDFTKSRFFTYEDAQKAAKTIYAGIFTKGSTLSFPEQFDWKQHYSLISQHGFTNAHDQNGMQFTINDTNIGVTKHNVIPRFWDEEFSVKTGYFRTASFLLLRHAQNPRDYWGHALMIAPELLDHVPSDRAHILKEHIHEKRHLHQIKIKGIDFVTDYYIELDATLASITSLKNKKIGKETIEAEQHSRYFNMFFSPPKYFFAADLENLQNGGTPNGFFKTYGAVTEIRMRISENLTKKPFAPLNPKDFQEAIIDGSRQNVLKFPLSQYMSETINHFGECQKRILGKNPASLFTALRQVLEQGVFSDPLTEHIATNIINAACHFNQDLIMDDNKSARKRLQERLLSKNNQFSKS